MAELNVLGLSAPVLWRTPRGDGHSVLVLPPFMVGDTSTTVLRTFLSGRGYTVHGWRLGRNLWRTARIVDGLPKRLQEVYERSGRKVSLIGWSAGGIQARDLAREHPSLVRQVISLGSPFRHQDGDGSHAEPIARMFMDPAEQVPLPTGRWLAEEDKPPLQVPNTAIYSRSDGVTPWQLCLNCDGPNCESIEVRGSHVGLAHNVAVFVAVADRLSQPENDWQPFRPPNLSRAMFPPPLSWPVDDPRGSPSSDSPRHTLASTIPSGEDKGRPL